MDTSATTRLAEPGDNPVDVPITIVLTRFGLRGFRQLLLAYLDYRRAMSQASPTLGLLRRVFLIEDQSTCYRLLIGMLVIMFVAGCSDPLGVTSEDGSPNAAAPSQTVVAAQPSPAIAMSACPVTEPNGSVPPGEDRDCPNCLGNGELWTVLWADGKVVFDRKSGPGEVRRDGSLSMKFPWWRGPNVQGELAIEGRRLDGPAEPLQAEIPGGYAPTGIQPTTLVFPTEGCWEVTGRVGDSSLTFVTAVVVK
jgi:hypothetical protein